MTDTLGGFVTDCATGFAATAVLHFCPVFTPKVLTANMTRRLLILLIFAVLAAAPLVWLNVEPRAGEILLALLSKS